MSAVPRPRDPGLELDASIPRHWFGGSPVASHIVNGLNLLFPAGERFFVRSVSRHLDEIRDDPALLERVRGFAGQEGLHAGAHERFFQVMRAQGYRIDGLLRAYERFAYGFLERVLPASVALASTVAAEHYTAILADGALEDGFLDAAHPTLAALLRWHAAEEIEHKDVAFDVLARVRPGYALRVAGLIVATGVLAVFWAAATIMLLRQDGLTLREVLRDLRRLRRRDPILRRAFGRGLRDYLRRDFHPRDVDNLEVARRYLKQAGLEPA